MENGAPTPFTTAPAATTTTNIYHPSSSVSTKPGQLQPGCPALDRCRRLLHKGPNQGSWPLGVVDCVRMNWMRKRKSLSLRMKASWMVSKEMPHSPRLRAMFKSAEDGRSGASGSSRLPPIGFTDAPAATSLELLCASWFLEFLRLSVDRPPSGIVCRNTESRNAVTIPTS